MNDPDFLSAKLEERKATGAYRMLSGDKDGTMDFFSNDYLGLVSNGLLKGDQGSERTGSTGSRLLSGDSSIALDLEQFLADYHKEEAALLFQSGYMANLGLLSCIARRTDTIIYDKLAHASLRQGIQLAPAKSYSFKHNDSIDLEDKIKRSSGQVYVVVESVYSMDGDLGDLERLASVCKKYQALLIVDEAHGTGTFGDGGRGLVNELNMEDHVWARINTFGKAGGSHGAVVLGSAILIDYLKNFSKPFIYTTAPSDHSLSLIREAYSYFEDGSLQRTLNERIKYFEERAASYAFNSSIIPSKSAIRCLHLGCSEKAVSFAEVLQTNGIRCKAVRYPTVPKDGDRIRFCLHAHNTKEQIDYLVEKLSELPL